MAAPDIICVQILDGAVDYGELKAASPAAVDSNSTSLVNIAWRVPTEQDTGHTGGRKFKYCGTLGNWIRTEDYPPDYYLDRDKIVVAGDYSLTGTALTVTNVYLFSNHWNTSQVGPPNYIPCAQFEHRVYLKLSGNLAEGTITINFPDDLGISNFQDSVTVGQLAPVEFAYNYKTTRAKPIKTTQVGHRPGDEIKAGYLSEWIPGAPNEGQIDFMTTYGFDEFQIINANGDAVYTGSITERISGTDREHNHGENLLGRAGFVTDGYMRYASTSIPPAIITDVTSGSPPVVTTSAPHGFVQDEIVWIYCADGMHLLYGGNVNYVRVNSPTSTTFQVYHYSGGWTALGASGTFTPGGTGYVFKTHISNRAGTFVFDLDYTVADIPNGTYRLYIPNFGVGDPFVIGEHAWHIALEYAAAGEYHLRSGAAKDGRFGYTAPVRLKSASEGGQAHQTVKKSTCPYVFTNYGPTSGPITVGEASFSPYATATEHTGAWGEWQDAGDWDTRLIDHCIGGSYMLLNTYSILPEASRNTLNLNTPKSTAVLDADLYAGTDDLSDLVHAALWQADCYRRMQNPSGHATAPGAVSGGITYNLRADNGDQSGGDGDTSWILDYPIHSYHPDHITTFYYAMLAAKMAKVFEDEPTLGSTDKTRLVDLYTESAELAYTWADNILTDATARNAFYQHTKTANGGTLSSGAYDAVMVNIQAQAAHAKGPAAGALFRLTGTTAYSDDFVAWWGLGQATYAIAHAGAWEYYKSTGGNSTVKTACRNNMVQQANYHMDYYEGAAGLINCYGNVKYPSADTFGNGGGTMVDNGQVLIAAHRIVQDEPSTPGALTPASRYIKALQSGQVYLHGANQRGWTFTSGLGVRDAGNVLWADAQVGDYRAGIPRGITNYGSTQRAGLGMFNFNVWESQNWHAITDMNAGPNHPNLDTYDIRHRLLSTPNRFQIPVYDFYLNYHLAAEQMELVVTQSGIPQFWINAYLHTWDGNTVTADSTVIRLKWA
jgi:hypothetical protein